MNLTVCQSNVSVLNTKTVNAVNDCLNIVSISCGKDVFLLSHEKSVARYALSRDSKVKKSLFTTPITTRYKNLGATSVVVKSRLSVAKTTTVIDKRVLEAYDWQSITAKIFMGTVCFGYDHLQQSLDMEIMLKKHFIVHTWYNKTPYELIQGRKPNIKYFHLFGSLFYPTNDRDDLGKMKLKANIGIFIGYSMLSRGFCIYNRQTIMEMIHVKFDELTTMASECNNSGPGLNCLNFQDSSNDMNKIPSQQDLDNLFDPLYDEYYASSTSEVINNSVTNTLDVEDTPSPSSIIVEDIDASQIVTSSEEPIIQESSIPVLEIILMNNFKKMLQNLMAILLCIFLKS
nr:hypothetical protein [Tanacetum cinerariifolium]